MKISYRRTGGFAGMLMTFDIDTESLPQEEADELSQLVDSANFFALPSEVPSPGEGADRFQYRLTVETVEQQHTVEVSESAVPENLWPFIDKLRILSRLNRNP